ncbi:helix-turn-helix transcriptional regulator [Streptomyces sp. NPDC049813]|uniref:helix-turn-helix transcriptional regulator n=1 Tax=Streptomyces sp. NPDC049813 TaxID=3365597 RepID=UPI0037A2A221
MGDVTTMTTTDRTAGPATDDTADRGADGTRGRARERRRPELAAFLRGRRARVTPQDVGMPPGPRRRTPGLRREEVAQLSGVGVTWYTWLEQGRPINASPQVLDAVARTLRLGGPEREHLYRLAGVAFAPAPDSGGQAVAADVQGILDALDPLPAVVYNTRYDLLATNAGYRLLFQVREDLHDPTTGRPANALWTLFVAPEGLCPLLFRESELPVMVGILRSAYGRHVGEPGWEEFVRALSGASEEFARLWRSGDVAPPGRYVKTFRHQGLDGELRMTSTSLAIDNMPECRIVVYAAADEATRELLGRLRADTESSADRETTAGQERPGGDERSGNDEGSRP